MKHVEYDIQLILESSAKICKDDFKSSLFLLVRGPKTEFIIYYQYIENTVLLYSNDFINAVSVS